MGQNEWWSFTREFVLLGAGLGCLIYFVDRTLSKLQLPEDKEQVEKKNTVAGILQKLDRHAADEDGDAADPTVDENDYDDSDDPDRKHRRPRRRKYTDIVLNRYEQVIATDVVVPQDIPVSFADIGGLSHIIEELKEAVISPLVLPEIYAATSSLLSPPSGVLFYGPPGCGKTMLAKALAHESGATFINLHIESITEKWYGDSNKLCAAVFSLARKLQPCVIFIDEIDAVLGKRNAAEHEASTQVKAEFMTHWDGLTSSDTEGKPQGILILGATNRVQEIDEAIMRRMPKKFCVPLPSASQRTRIFSLVLKDTRLDQDDFDLDYLVRVSEGMSGSDIKEACRDAAMKPVRELIRKKREKNGRLGKIQADEIRGVTTGDFFESAGGVEVSQAVLDQLQASPSSTLQPKGLGHADR